MGVLGGVCVCAPISNNPHQCIEMSLIHIYKNFSRERSWLRFLGYACLYDVMTHCFFQVMEQPASPSLCLSSSLLIVRASATLLPCGLFTLQSVRQYFIVVGVRVSDCSMYRMPSPMPVGPLHFIFFWGMMAHLPNCPLACLFLMHRSS